MSKPEYEDPKEGEAYDRGHKRALMGFDPPTRIDVLENPNAFMKGYWEGKATFDEQGAKS